jgi:hypothetical protein
MIDLILLMYFIGVAMGFLGGYFLFMVRYIEGY